jgi:hypothetical protein
MAARRLVSDTGLTNMTRADKIVEQEVSSSLVVEARSSSTTHSKNDCACWRPKHFQQFVTPCLAKTKTGSSKTKLRCEHSSAAIHHAAVPYNQHNISTPRKTGLKEDVTGLVIVGRSVAILYRNTFTTKHICLR